MSAIPFTVVCSMLDIDAKTLRQWLKHNTIQIRRMTLWMGLRGRGERRCGRGVG